MRCNLVLGECLRHADGVTDQDSNEAHSMADLMELNAARSKAKTINVNDISGLKVDLPMADRRVLTVRLAPVRCRSAHSLLVRADKRAGGRQLARRRDSSWLCGEPRDNHMLPLRPPTPALHLREASDAEERARSERRAQISPGFSPTGLAYLMYCMYCKGRPAPTRTQCQAAGHCLSCVTS